MQDEKHYAPKTISRKLAALSSYFDFLVEKGLMENNPSLSVRRPRKEVLNPSLSLTRKQVLDLFSILNDRRCSPLHRALIITLFTTGLRKSEVIFLKRKDLKKNTGRYFLLYRAKGGKRGRKLLHPRCVETLKEYLRWMEQKGRKHHQEDWLFQPTRNPSHPEHLNKPLNPKTVNEILDFYGKKTGLDIRLSPHCARATFISELLENGTNIYRVAQEVNHSSVKTTQEYDRRIRKFKDSPIDKLKY